MKYLATFLGLTSFAIAAQAASFTNSPDVDAFVSAATPTLNYGAAGALTVSGTLATNMSGFTNGVYDSFIRFNTAAMVSSFNSLYGPNNWSVSSAKLRLVEMGAPPQTIFNRGKGSFEVRWIANTNWTEGTGTPMTPTMDGIVYTNELVLLNTNTDVSLGIYTNAGVNFTNSFQLGLQPAFTSSLASGGEVDLFLTAADTKIGFTFNSQNFTGVSSRPILVVSAIPRPTITGFNLVGTNAVFTGTNGVVNGTYYTLSSTNAGLPFSQWTPVATNILSTGGNFSITATNAAAVNAAAQFFILQAQ
jgi:hypothetical protein